MPERAPGLWRSAGLVAAKDLRVEWRARVTLNQVAPFALLSLVLFAFALDPDRGILERATAGLFWLAVLFCTVLAVQRAFALESADASRDALRLAGVPPASVFLGKAAALAVQLAVLEVVLGVGVVLFYGAPVTSLGVLTLAAVPATVGLVAVGTLYGVLSAGLRVRDTLLPLLFLPVATPALIGATRAFEAALFDDVGGAWPWIGLLGVYAVVAVVVGALTFGSLLDEA